METIIKEICGDNREATDKEAVLVAIQILRDKIHAEVTAKQLSDVLTDPDSCLLSALTVTRKGGAIFHVSVVVSAVEGTRPDRVN